MVATQNIDTLGPIWTFPLRGVLTFVASGLDINGCVLSYFEGTANLLKFTHSWANGKSEIVAVMLQKKFECALGYGSVFC